MNLGGSNGVSGGLRNSVWEMARNNGPLFNLNAVNPDSSGPATHSIWRDSLLSNDGRAQQSVGKLPVAAGGTTPDVPKTPTPPATSSNLSMSTAPSSVFDTLRAFFGSSMSTVAPSQASVYRMTNLLSDRRPLMSGSDGATSLTPSQVLLPLSSLLQSRLLGNRTADQQISSGTKKNSDVEVQEVAQPPQVVAPPPPQVVAPPPPQVVAPPPPRVVAPPQPQVVAPPPPPVIEVKPPATEIGTVPEEQFSGEAESEPNDPVNISTEPLMPEIVPRSDPVVGNPDPVIVDLSPPQPGRPSIIEILAKLRAARTPAPSPLSSIESERLNLMLNVATKGAPNSAERSAVLRAYNEFRPDETTVRELEQIASTVAAATLRPGSPFTQASANWNTPGFNKRRALEEFVDLMNQKLGMNVGLEFFSSPTVNGNLTTGFYSSNADIININLNSKSFASAMKTIFHEMVHALHVNRTRDLSVGEIMSKSERGEISYTDAMVYFNLCPGLYFSAKDTSYRQYQMNPHEQIAFIGQHLFESELAVGITDTRRTLASNHPLLLHLQKLGIA